MWMGWKRAVRHSVINYRLTVISIETSHRGLCRTLLVCTVHTVRERAYVCAVLVVESVGGGAGHVCVASVGGETCCGLCVRVFPSVHTTITAPSIQTESSEHTQACHGRPHIPSNRWA